MMWAGMQHRKFYYLMTYLRYRHWLKSIRTLTSPIQQARLQSSYSVKSVKVRMFSWLKHFKGSLRGTELIRSYVYCFGNSSLALEAIKLFTLKVQKICSEFSDERRKFARAWNNQNHGRLNVNCKLTINKTVRHRAVVSRNFVGLIAISGKDANYAKRQNATIIIDNDKALTITDEIIDTCRYTLIVIHSTSDIINVFLLY